MGWDDIAESVCPVARSLAVLGDRWTLLIVRELFLGTRRFDAFQVQTGMSPHLLSGRLKRLENDGVIERRPYQQRPPRYEYRLTEKGKDLLGVVLALRAWGLRWCGLDPTKEPAVRLFHTECGSEVGPIPICRQCGKLIEPKDITAKLSGTYATEREARGSAVTAEKTPAAR
ncbi:MAG: helix-turn-helix transcriptional regulator [Defluviicoccus sp.]|nr:MAG: helix-turn-helix transcriptional regulator [Defluviicoccus sp.]